MHTFREANRCADAVAAIRSYRKKVLSVLTNVPDDDDVRKLFKGDCIPRTVSVARTGWLACF